MAVLSVKELHDKRNSATEDGVTTHRRGWLVVCDDPADGTAVALVANGIPNEGDTYNGATLIRKEANPKDDSRTIFVVDGEYTDDPGEIEDMGVSPLDRPAEISWDYEEATAEYSKDHTTPTAKAVTNSAGEPFDPWPARDDGWLVITVTKNEATHDPAAADALKNTLNSAIVTIDGKTYAAGTLKMSPIRAAKITERFNGADVNYYRKTYILKARAAGWNHVLLDVGFNEKVGNEWKPIKDQDGEPVRMPWPLDGAGVKKASPTDVPAELTFKPYASNAWTGITFA